MVYNQQDFSEMELNPFGVPKGVKVFDHYRLLKMSRIIGQVPKGIPGSWSPDDLDLLVRFLILMHDTESPLYAVSNLEDKKKYAVDLLSKKWPMDKWANIWSEIAKEGDLFLQKLYEFFVIINEHDYEHWVSLKIQIHRFNEELRSKFKPDKSGSIAANLNARRAISKDINQLKSQLDSVEARLFPDNKRLARKIAAVSMSQSIGGFAEKYALDGPWVT